MSRRLFRRVWLVILVICLIALVFLLNIDELQEQHETHRKDWIPVRLSKDQREYVDAHGVHVVVGHYMGDPSNSGNPNLTDEVLNSNLFAPLPNEGKDGMPVIIPAHLSSKMRQLYHINRFNLMASDRIPLNRSLPDVRKKKCMGKYNDIQGLPKTTVIIVFHNEAWSTLLRTVHSVINRSPSILLQEILLVDDASTRKFLGKELDDYVSRLSIPTRVIRTTKRIGLIRARILGAKEANGQILTFLDAHCECTTGWLEALVTRVAEDRTRVVCPVIDIISDETFAYIRSFELHWGAFNWDLHFRWYTISGDELKKRRQDITEPFSSPAMAGGLFAMDKNFFFALGSYDDRMEVWGGENLEMSFRVWQCGGTVEIAPCSHVGHLFRKSSPYSFPGGVTKVLYGNLVRVALVWMDEWKDFFFKFNPEAERLKDLQPVRSRIELRKKLSCKSFKWYLDTVWPEHFFPTEDRFFGKIKNVVRGECLEKPTSKGSLNQPMGPALLVPCGSNPVLSQMFVMETDGFIATDESICLDAPDKDDTPSPRVKVLACSGNLRQKWSHNKKNRALKHISSDLCLDLPKDGSIEKGLVLNPCDESVTQQWTLEPIPWR